jgi:acyl-CoA thioesterase
MRLTTDDGPSWGDAADLIALLDVQPDGEASWIGMARPGHGRSVVEGSQMLGQAIVAAGRHAPGRRVVSASMVFVRAADTDRPVRLHLDELSAGRTFVALGVRVEQEDVICANGWLLLDVTAPDVVRHGVVAPDVAGPHESEPFDMSVVGRDVHVVDAAYTDDADAPVGPPVIDAWVRYRDVPDDPVLHAALLAQFTGHMSIAAALRPHAGIGQEEAHRTLSTAINTITLSFHREVRADRWMLYHHLSTFAGDGMTHSECRVHDEVGELLASFTVDAMVRTFGAGTAVDERRSL